jgi:type I restriction-modification system DNA methylase subunit
MFQAAMSGEKRHELGAHYTEESNILKITGPLFMDGLGAEFEIAKTNKNRLQTFHDKLAGLKFLDPACGTGNFLIIAYRELRRLEIKVLEALYAIESSAGSTIQMVFEAQDRAKVNVDQFYGIEIDEFACEIARLGMWLMDHQCNLELSAAMGMYYVRLPLAHSATIVCGNALRIDWESVVSKRELGYILGNPPFVGARNMASGQKDRGRAFTNGEKWRKKCPPRPPTQLTKASESGTMGTWKK